MADWSLYGDGQQLTAGTASASYGVDVSASSANTKGSYVELISSSASAKPATGFYFSIYRTALPAWDGLVDIAIGGAGSEQIIVSDMGFVSNLTGSQASMQFLPIAIPASTRVAARVQTGYGGGTTNNYSMIHLVHGGSKHPTGLAGATGIGANTADSGGVAISAGSGSKGSYVEVVSSTARAYRGISLRAHTRNSVLADTKILVDIAIGAAASEVIIASNLPLYSNGGIEFLPYIPLHIPSGVRVAARAAGSAALNFDVSIVGFY